ncbi:MAG: hypothetical protein ABEI86_06180, partial [Halobacteriaceae archaeon]
MTRISSQLSSKREVVLIGGILGVFPLILTARAFILPGFPFDGEIFSNLLPALHARHSIANGQLPIYTELFYSGRYQFANPLWYGFYPPAWLLFIPGIPLDGAIKFLLAVHLFITPGIAYYYSEQEVPWFVAAPFALLWVMPIAAQLNFAHLEKVFAWPWLVLVACQCLPERFRSDSRRDGRIAGIGLGMILLAGGNYYFAYGLALIVIITVTCRAQKFGRGVIEGSIVGVPHLISIAPVLLGGASRPAVGYTAGVFDVVDLLSGLFVTPMAYVRFVGQGYAVIGLPVLLLTGYGIHYAHRHTNDWWVAGISAAGIIGWALATGNQVLYSLPGVSILRVSSRATVLVAIAALLLALYGATQLTRPKINSEWRQILVVSLLVLSVLVASIAWVNQTQLGYTTSPDEANEIAGQLKASDCESVWLASNPSWNSSASLPVDSTELGFALTKRDIAVRAVHYGAIGQQWTVYNETGQLSFDVLLTGGPLPANGSINLSVADSSFRTVG